MFYIYISALLGYLSSVPRNLNYTYEIQRNISNVLFINLTWDAPEYTHGDIQNYMVEYMTDDVSDPVTSDVTSVGTYCIHTYKATVYVYIHTCMYGMVHKTLQHVRESL